MRKLERLLQRRRSSSAWSVVLGPIGAPAIAFVLSSEGLASGEALAALLVWPLLVGVAAASALLYGALAKPEAN